MPTRDGAPNGAPCWIELFTSDVERSRAFYGELFGWTSEDPKAEFGGYFNSFVDGVMVAGGMQNDGASGPDRWNVYLASADAGQTVEAAAAQGAQIVVPAMDVMDLGTMAVMIDPGGAGIGAWTGGTHKGFGVIDEPGAPTWFELHTRAYDDSVDFYRKVFGWDAHTTSDSPEFRYTTLGLDENALAGVMDSANFLAAGEPSSWQVYFRVNDTDETIKKVTALGGSVFTEGHDSPHGRLAVVADPTGARFRLRQHS
jgi:predicted enzyme related to lactoylglutathione lyase